MTSSSGADTNASPPRFGSPERELVVAVKAAAGIHVTPEGMPSSPAVNVAGICDLLESRQARLQTLSGLSEGRMRARAASLPSAAPDLSVYYHVRAAEERLDDLAAYLNGEDAVEGAYVKPRGELPVEPDMAAGVLNDMAPDAAEPGIETPDYESHQAYLGPAPGGIDAHYAWTLAGGRGSDVNITDLEWGWRFSHEDLTGNQGGVVAGTNSIEDDHGTAVIGVYSGDRNGFGVTGISSEARATAVAFSMPTATAIRQAADRLRPGDIMLLEIHMAGPRFNFQETWDKSGYIPIEWWPDDFAAIQYAIARGVIVVEAAGNGGENLDDAIYEVAPAGFPAAWSNPFNPANPQSGAILVGAGAPPPGTHGRDHGPDRSRLSYSNYGARLDAQGWGREVTTTGYGKLQGGSNHDEWYTDEFSGTSSASPIVVGALACAQGIRRAQGAALLTPATAKSLLRSTGSPQQDAIDRPATQRIGNRPNLRQMVSAPGSAWFNDVTITMTYCTTDAQNAWASIDGVGWRKIRPGQAEDVTRMFGTLCEVAANQRTVSVYADSKFIQTVNLS